MALARTAPPVALAAALALGLGACGGPDTETAPTAGTQTSAPAADAPTDGSAGEPTDESTATADQTETAETGDASVGDYSVGQTVPLAELKERIEAAMQEAGTMTMVSDGTPMQVEILEDSINVRSDETDESVIFVDGVLYVEAGPDIADMVDGKGWIVIDPDSDDPMSQMFTPVLSAMSSMAEPAAVMPAGDKDATVSAVDGDEVTLEFVLTEAEVRAHLSEIYGADLNSLSDVPELSGGMTHRYTVDTSTWLPVRIETDHSDQSMSVVEYTGFGEPVDIEAPPAEDTSPFTLDFGDLADLGDLSTP